MQLRISDKKNSKLWTAASTMKAISAGDPKDLSSFFPFPFEAGFPLSFPLPFPSVGARINIINITCQIMTMMTKIGQRESAEKT